LRTHNSKKGSQGQDFRERTDVGTQSR